MAGFDANGDGVLESRRAGRIRRSPARPGIELCRWAGSRPRAAAIGSDRRSSATSFASAASSTAATSCNLGEVDIDFNRNNRDPQQADLVEFRTFDRDNNDYIDEREAGDQQHRQRGVRGHGHRRQQQSVQGRVDQLHRPPERGRRHAAAAGSLRPGPGPVRRARRRPGRRALAARAAHGQGRAGRRGQERRRLAGRRRDSAAADLRAGARRRRARRDRSPRRPRPRHALQPPRPTPPARCGSARWIATTTAT